MTQELSILQGKVRTALDDIAPEAVDSFAADVNTEIEQALLHAAVSLSRELPVDMLEIAIEREENPGYRSDDESGYVALPEDYLRFIALRSTLFEGQVTELIEPGSEAEKWQRSVWSRGSATKPKAMIDANEDGGVLRYWPGKESGTVTMLWYIPMANQENGRLVCALREAAEKNLVYTACRIFLEGKKDAAADKFAQLATI